MKIKGLIFVPIVLLVLSITILYQNHQRTGDWINKDIDLKGGTLITIESTKPIDASKIEGLLAKEYGSVIISSLRTVSGYGATIEVEVSVDAEEVVGSIKGSGITVDNYSVETIGPTLGRTFFFQVRNVLIFGFALMGIVIFFTYKSIIPSIGIVAASGANILTTLALTSLLGIKISFAGFAGLLMLIAYTVDTNIVLTTKVLRSGKENYEREYKTALITGLTLIATITLTMFVTLMLSTSKLLTNIASILIVGFLNDLFYTWLMNGGLLEFYVERVG